MRSSESALNRYAEQGAEAVLIPCAAADSGENRSEPCQAENGNNESFRSPGCGSAITGQQPGGLLRLGG